MSDAPATTISAELQRLLDERRAWYHVIDLGDGRTTPGIYDLRGLPPVAGLPSDLSGLRAVDLGTFDGFWAFEMARRGAEVVAIDSDEIPPPDTPRIHRARLAREAGQMRPGEAFDALRDHLGLEARHVVCNVHDLTRDIVGGAPDIVFCGALLQHLRDPLGALEVVHSVLADDGELYLLEAYHEPRGRAGRRATAEYRARDGWTIWMPTRACLVEWVRTAGFSEVTEVDTATLTDRRGARHHVVGMRARR